MLVPTIRAMGIRSLSSWRNTAKCAKPLAPPPASTTTTEGLAADAAAGADCPQHHGVTNPHKSMADNFLMNILIFNIWILSF
jgi:hypothetical protein